MGCTTSAKLLVVLIQKVHTEPITILEGKQFQENLQLQPWASLADGRSNPLRNPGLDLPSSPFHSILIINVSA